VNLKLKTIFKSFKNKDMLKRILIVLGIIIVYRFLSQVPVPMGDPTTFKDAVTRLLSSSDLGSFINLVSGGGLASFSIILVGLSPYITASIVMQLITKVVPRLEELHKDGETGRRKINQWTRMITIPLAIIQSIAYIFILQKTMLATNTAAYVEPSMYEWIISVTAMTAGSVILMWFGELITEQGVGNGISMVIMASIVSRFPATLASIGTSLFDTTNGSLSLFGWLSLPVNPTVFWIMIGFVVGIILVLYILVKINEAQRIVTINYAKRVRGNRTYGGIKSILPMKLITAGVIPVIFAVAFLSLPAFVGQIIKMGNPDSSLATNLITWFSSPSAQNFTGLTPEWFIYPIAYFALVVAFTYFYTGIVFNTTEIAENLQKQGGFIEGVRPGQHTVKYLGTTMNRLNLFGSLSLGLIAMLPFITDYIFIVTTGAPIGLSLSGTGLLIVVTVALENIRQVNSRALMITYDDYK
jgi:preprotein translocase subunit SecY